MGTPRTRKPRRPFAALARLALLSLSTFGCAPVGEISSSQPPNVLILVLDACRADRLGAYGFDRPTSPAIDALAADPDSTLFERYYVQAPWTKPSTASLFTGLWVQQHRVMVGAREEPAPGRLSVLPQELTTLAEAFREAGYATFSITENHQLAPAFGFDQGFDSYRMVTGGDRRLATLALDQARQTDRPFFGYVHFVGCHYPFPQYLRASDYLDEYAPEYDEEARQSAGVDFTSPALARRINRGELELEQGDVDFLRVLYESKLRHLDRIVIEPLVAGLREAGLYDDTLIVLTSDHGEELYEHRGYTHGHALWEEVIRVPLIAKFPRGARPEGLGPRWPGLTSSIDLFPTLAAVAQLVAPPGLAGRNLLESPPPARVFSENGVIGWALLDGSLKAMVDYGGGVPSAPGGDHRTRRYVYDLATDPGELDNRITDRRADFAQARELVAELRKRHPPLAPEGGVLENPELSPEAIENLRSLGYVE